MTTRRTFFAAAVTGLFAVLPASHALAGGTMHKLALQISDNDPDKMTAVLNVASNVSRLYAAKGEDVEIQIVAFNAGLHMLRTDTSPVKDRLQSFAQGMPNVSFKACNNTREAMSKREGKEIEIVPQATLVPAGAITLIELNEKGWTILRP